MKCAMCNSNVISVEHIAIDDKGDPQVLCCSCYDKVKIFFREVKRRGKVKS